MNIKFLTVAAGIALSATAFTAKAQKTYSEGVATYATSVNGMAGEAKISFKGDSAAMSIQQGPAAIKVLSFKEDYLAVLVNVPVANMKKAAVATPGELEDAMSKLPNFTFTKTTETKEIAGFKCFKVIAKDEKGTSFDTWVTTDIIAPTSAYSHIFAKVGGFPVQFTLTQMGRPVTNTLKTISDEKVAAGTFSIPAGYDRITLSDLSSMGGR